MQGLHRRGDRGRIRLEITVRPLLPQPHVFELRRVDRVRLKVPLADPLELQAPLLRVRLALPERGDELLEIGHEVMVGNSRVDK